MFKLSKLTPAQSALAAQLGATAGKTTATFDEHPTIVLRRLDAEIADAEYRDQRVTAMTLRDKVEPVEADFAPLAEGEKHSSCPTCGFAFSKPQARCKVAAACEKRAAALVAA